jgi:hypothetical protein
MSGPILTHPTGPTPSRNGTRPPARVIPLLADLTEKVEHLAELRHLIHQAEATERVLTQEVIAALTRAALDRFQGRTALAILGTRTTLRPDVALFHEALGPRAFEAMTVNVTAARRLMAADDLEAISETTSTPVLRVEALPAAPAVA